jgi:hypothetical protein
MTPVEESLSRDKDRLTEHLSGIANKSGGGFMVFGIDDSADSRITLGLRLFRSG